MASSTATGKGIEFRHLLLRGVLGGVVGTLVWCSVSGLSDLDKWQSNRVSWLTYMVIAYLLYGLPIGALAGGGVGTAIWAIHAGWRVEVGPLARFGTGTVLAAAFWTLFLVLASTQGFTPQSRQSLTIAVLEFGITVGGVSGLISGRQTTEEGLAVPT